MNPHMVPSGARAHADARGPVEFVAAYIRARQAPHVKHFEPLSDDAKPSMKKRVQMYMTKLAEEETKERNRMQRAAGGSNANFRTHEGITIQEH